MKIYVCTDTHLGHKSLLKHGTREAGFEKTILDNLRAVDGDMIIHLGDVCIGEDEKWHKEILSAMSGFKRKVLIKGNHDHKSNSWYFDIGWDMVLHSMSLKAFGKHCLFTHGPVLIRDYGGSYTPFFLNIHGHLHGDGVKRANGIKTDHRQEDSEKANYDLAYHKDVAPELYDSKPVLLETLINNS